MKHKLIQIDSDLERINSNDPTSFSKLMEMYNRAIHSLTDMHLETLGYDLEEVERTRGRIIKERFVTCKVEVLDADLSDNRESKLSATAILCDGEKIGEVMVVKRGIDLSVRTIYERSVDNSIEEE